MLKKFFFIVSHTILATFLLMGCRGEPATSSKNSSTVSQELRAQLKTKPNDLTLPNKTSNKAVSDTQNLSGSASNGPSSPTSIKKEGEVTPSTFSNTEGKVEDKAEQNAYSIVSANGDPNPSKGLSFLSSQDKLENVQAKLSLDGRSNEGNTLNTVLPGDSDIQKETDSGLHSTGPLKLNGSVLNEVSNQLSKGASNSVQKNDLGLKPIEKLSPRVLEHVDPITAGTGSSGSIPLANVNNINLAKADPLKGVVIASNKPGDGILSSGPLPVSITNPPSRLGTGEGEGASNTPSDGTLSSGPLQQIIVNPACKIFYRMKFKSEESTVDQATQLSLNSLRSDPGKISDATIEDKCGDIVQTGFVRVLYFNNFTNPNLRSADQANQFFTDLNQNANGATLWKQSGESVQQWDIPIEANVLSLNGQPIQGGFYLFLYCDPSSSPSLTKTPRGKTMTISNIDDLRSKLLGFDFLRAVQFSP
jgi:hypothetical protein